MINQIFRLISPRNIQREFNYLSYDTPDILIKPSLLSICHADQRYYTGQREKAILQKKLPMALIHEATGIVVNDSTGKYRNGDTVLLIPNTPEQKDSIVLENYNTTSKFRGSGIDGFMQEFITMPEDRIIKYQNINPLVA